MQRTLNRGSTAIVYMLFATHSLKGGWQSRICVIKDPTLQILRGKNGNRVEKKEKMKEGRIMLVKDPVLRIGLRHVFQS